MRKKFVANTIPDRPYYEFIKKIKNGNYDPYIQKTGANNLYKTTYNYENSDYFDSLTTRAIALVRESETNYHSILDAHFIRF